MTEEQLWIEIKDVWQKTIDALKAGHDCAIENCDYKDAITFSIAIQQCYLAMNGNKPDFEGIDLP